MEQNQNLQVTMAFDLMGRLFGRGKYAVDRRHGPDDLWVELHRFPSRRLAKRAMRQMITTGDAAPRALRVRRVPAVVPRMA